MSSALSARATPIRHIYIILAWGRHWTSTAQEERVVMIVLGYTITLDLWQRVAARVRGAEGLGGLA